MFGFSYREFENDWFILENYIYDNYLFKFVQKQLW